MLEFSLVILYHLLYNERKSHNERYSIQLIGHWDGVIRILCCIKGTLGQGVLYENRGHTHIIGYCDEEWAGLPTNRHSTSRYCVFIGGNLISWKSKKQDVVVKFSAEVKYQAMDLATCKLIWLR